MHTRNFLMQKGRHSRAVQKRAAEAQRRPYYSPRLTGLLLGFWNGLRVLGLA